MAFKFVAILAFVAVASAVPVEYVHQSAPALVHAPTLVKAVAAPVYKQVEYEHEAPAEYDFHYAVHDEHTGDIKSQQESRKGHAVQGRYELIDSDGYRRIVEYTADEHTGFNAIVHREPTDIKIPVPAPVHYAAAPAHYAAAAPAHYAAAAPAHYAATAPAHYAAAPVHYAAPVAKIAAPITKIAVAPVAKVAVAPIAYNAVPAYHH